LAVGLFPARVMSAEIQRVEVRVSETPSAVDPNMRGTRLAGPASDVMVSGGETVEVYWTPGRGRIEAGSGVTLEYRRAYGDALHTEARPVNADTGVARKTVFLIEPTDSELSDGPILMWRVRLVHEGKVLAEKTSANWR
jgi:hypothetical protein